MLFLILPFHTFAHTDNSEGYSKLSYDDSSFLYELSLDYLELARIVDLGIGTNDPTNLLEASLKTNEKQVNEYIQSKLAVFNQGVKLEGAIIDTNVERRLNRDYANYYYALSNRKYGFDRYYKLIMIFSLRTMTLHIEISSRMNSSDKTRSICFYLG